MSAQLMALVRELKALNARKKAGEALSGPEESRRKELKIFLRAQLEPGSAASPSTGDAGAETSAPVEASPPASPPVSPPPVSSPPPRPSPRPATIESPPRTPMPPSPRTPAPVPVASPPSPSAPPAYVPKKDAYAISGAGSFIDAAMGSEAVGRVDPNRHAQASAGDIADAEAQADAALRANKRAKRAHSPEEVEAELRETQAFYTPSENAYVLEQYYGEYFDDGLSMAPASETADLLPVDPREIEARRAIDIAVGSGAGATTVTVPPGLAFLDDFGALYSRRILAPPGDVADAGTDDPNMLIGRRKVTVHLLNGEKKQGLVRALRRGEQGFKLEAAGGGEEIALAQVKAVFVHLQPNAQQVSPGGKSITVLFRDKRAVQGESGDYEPQAPVFSLVPPAGRGQFEKIVINAAAVISVS